MTTTSTKVDVVKMAESVIESAIRTHSIPSIAPSTPPAPPAPLTFHEVRSSRKDRTKESATFFIDSTCQLVSLSILHGPSITHLRDLIEHHPDTLKNPLSFDVHVIAFCDTLKYRKFLTCGNGFNIIVRPTVRRLRKNAVFIKGKIEYCGAKRALGTPGHVGGINGLRTSYATALQDLECLREGATITLLHRGAEREGAILELSASVPVKQPLDEQEAAHTGKKKITTEKRILTPFVADFIRNGEEENPYSEFYRMDSDMFASLC